MTQPLPPDLSVPPRPSQPPGGATESAVLRAAAATLRECHQVANGGRWRIELLVDTPDVEWVGPIVGGRNVGEVLRALPLPLAGLLDGIAANTEQRGGRPGPAVLDLCRAVLGTMPDPDNPTGLFAGIAALMAIVSAVINAKAAGGES